MFFFFFYVFSFLLSRGFRLLRAVKAGDQVVPLDGPQIELVLVVKIDAAKRASRRAGANRAAVADAREALKVLAVGSKSAGVLVEGRLQLVARIELVDLVVAGAGCVGAGAEEDAANFTLFDGSAGDGNG